MCACTYNFNFIFFSLQSDRNCLKIIVKYFKRFEIRIMFPWKKKKKITKGIKHFSSVLKLCSNNRYESFDMVRRVFNNFKSKTLLISYVNRGVDEMQEYVAFTAD